MYKYKTEIFTSDLIVLCKSEEDLEEIKANIPRAEKSINEKYSYFNHTSNVWKTWREYGNMWLPPNLDTKVVKAMLKYCYDMDKPDITCCLKGLFLSEVSIEGEDDFLINFGGDVYGYGNWDIPVEGTNMVINNPSDSFAIFSSGNYGKRGEHIHTLKENVPTLLTSVILGPDADRLANYDALTTLVYAGYLEDDVCREVEYLYTYKGMKSIWKLRSL